MRADGPPGWPLVLVFAMSAVAGILLGLETGCPWVPWLVIAACVPLAVWVRISQHRELDRIRRERTVASGGVERAWRR